MASRPSRYDIGAFATDDIAEGTILIPKWNESHESREGWVRLDPGQIRHLPPDARDLFLRYGLDVDFGIIAGPVDMRFVTTPDNFINHSCDPNLRYDPAGNIVAARLIRKGDEVYIDYGCFVVNFDEAFACSCGAHSCRGRISRDDWKKLALTYGMNMPRFMHARIARELKKHREARRFRAKPAPVLVGASEPTAA